MPSAKTARSSISRVTQPRSSATLVAEKHLAFWPLVVVMLILWVVYRVTFRGLPIWFDEVISKALFFGLPVWLYVKMGAGKKFLSSMSIEKMKPGLLLGLALGGLYGFAVILMLAIRQGATVIPTPYFMVPLFWGHFWLAMVTGFWETLFFYVWIMGVIREKHQGWSMWRQMGVAVAIFTVFHIPNALLQLPTMGAIRLVLLLAVFAAGQALIFYQRKNAYALMISQALWGLVLLVHLG